MYSASNELQQTIRDFSEVRANRMISLLTIYGFPAALLAGFFQFVVRRPPSTLYLGWGERAFAIPLESHGIHVGGFVTYLAVTGLFVLILRVALGRRRAPRSGMRAAEKKSAEPESGAR